MEFEWNIKNMNIDLLANTIRHLTRPKTGILAADESILTITKRFNAIGINSSKENRRAYRELLFRTPKLGEHISGCILFEETLEQTGSDGELFTKILSDQNIYIGIKVDKGLAPFFMTDNADKKEQITEGLDGLRERLMAYKAQGASFAKWRAVFEISSIKPSKLFVKTNVGLLARYAALCQEQDLVPIVEPEILMDGSHTIEQCAQVSETVLEALFHALHKYNVQLEYIVLKPSMILPGKLCSKRATAEQIAHMTLKIFKRTVPAAVPSINFLSGGQTPQEATENLQALKCCDSPWNISFSYGRALQEPCLKTWAGLAENTQAAQQALLERVKLNSL